MKRLFFTLAAALIICVPPAFGSDKAGTGAMISHDVDIAQITLLGITPGISTMSDVRRLFGVGDVVRTGNGERASERLCYISSKEGDYTKVVFEAPVAKGGAHSVLISIRLYAGDVRYEKAGSCVSSPLVDGSVKTDGGVGVGIDPEELKERLGSPTDEWPGYAGYEYHALRDLTRKEVERLKPHWPFVLKYPYVDIHSSVEARFYKGRLKRLDLMRVVARP